MLRRPDDQARLGAAAARRVHHGVEGLAGLRLERRDLLGTGDVAERADGRGAADRHDVGLASLDHQFGRDPVQGGGRFRAARQDADRPEDAVEQRIAGGAVGRIAPLHLVDQGERAAHPGMGRGRRRLARVVRLNRPRRHQMVGPISTGVGDQVFQLPRLVAAGREPGQVVALDPDLRTAQRAGEAMQGLDRGRQMGQANPGRGPVGKGDDSQRSALRKERSDGRL